jgi:hypothetical protein
MRMIHSLAIGMLTVLASSVAFAQDPAGMPAAPAEPAAPAAAPADPAAAPAAAPMGEAAASDSGGPVKPGVSAALLLGNGFKDGYGIGLGARVGYTLPMNLYIGGTFVYHLGKTESTPLGDYKWQVYYFGGEVGYDVAAGPLVIRPYAGIGLSTVKVDIPGFSFAGFTTPSTSASDSKVAIWPGATLLYPLGNAFVGADARFVVVSDYNAFSAFLTGGMNF